MSLERLTQERLLITIVSEGQAKAITYNSGDREQKDSNTRFCNNFVVMNEMFRFYIYLLPI